MCQHQITQVSDGHAPLYFSIQGGSVEMNFEFYQAGQDKRFVANTKLLVEFKFRMPHIIEVKTRLLLFFFESNQVFWVLLRVAVGNENGLVVVCCRIVQDVLCSVTNIRHSLGTSTFARKAGKHTAQEHSLHAFAVWSRVTGACTKARVL